MNALITAIPDLVKTFCSGVVSLCYRSGSSSPKFLWFRRLCFATCVKGMPKLLNNNKKEDKE